MAATLFSWILINLQWGLVFWDVVHRWMIVTDLSAQPNNTIFKVVPKRRWLTSNNRCVTYKKSEALTYTMNRAWILATVRYCGCEGEAKWLWVWNVYFSTWIHVTVFVVNISIYRCNGDSPILKFIVSHRVTNNLCLRNRKLWCLIYESRGTLWLSWLRHCDTSRKVAGSIRDGVIGIFSLT